MKGRVKKLEISSDVSRWTRGGEGLTVPANAAWPLFGVLPAAREESRKAVDKIGVADTQFVHADSRHLRRGRRRDGLLQAAHAHYGRPTGHGAFIAEGARCALQVKRRRVGSRPQRSAEIEALPLDFVAIGPSQPPAPTHPTSSKLATSALQGPTAEFVGAALSRPERAGPLA